MNTETLLNSTMFDEIRQGICDVSLEMLRSQEGEQVKNACAEKLGVIGDQLDALTFEHRETQLHAVSEAYLALLVYLQSNLQDEHDRQTIVESAIAQMEAHLQLVDSSVFSLDYLEIALGLVNAYRDHSFYLPDLTKHEQELSMALQLAEACQLIYQRVDKGVYRYRLLFAIALVQAKRYAENRDANLSQAIHCFNQIIRYCQAHPDFLPGWLPIVSNDLANTLVNHGTARDKALMRAKKAYHDGLESVDSSQTPKLNSILKKNLAWLESVMGSGNFDLTIDEILMRYRHKIDYFLAQGDLGQALDAAWGLLQSSWKHKDAPTIATVVGHEYIGKLLLEKGEKEGAFSHLNCALILVPAISDERLRQTKFTELRPVVLAQLQGQQQAPDQIEAYFANAEMAFSNAIEAYQTSAAASDKDPATALDASYQALMYFPFFPQAWFYQGIALLYFNQIDKALNAFTQCLMINPSSNFARVNRGTLYMQQQNFDEAEKDFEFVLKHDPGSLPAIINLVQIKLQKEQYQEALELLNSHKNQLKELAMFYRFRGICYENLQDYEAAIKNYQSAAERAEEPSAREWAGNRIKVLSEHI